MTDTPPLDPATEAAMRESARGVVARAGHRGLTYEAVAMWAKVEPAVVERRWPRLDELLVEVLTEAMTVEEIRDVGDTRRELTQAVWAMASSYEDWHRFERALFGLVADRAGDRELVERLRSRCVQRGREEVAAALRRAAARGDLPPDVDTDLVQDVWAGTIAYRHLVTGGPVTGDVVQSLLDLVLSGMAPLRAPEWSGGRPPEEPWWMARIDGWLYGIGFGQVFPLAGVPARALAEVPPTATVDGHPVTMSAGANRDFMPTTDPDGSALSVGVTVTPAGTGVLPPFLHADLVAVRHDDEVWVAPLVEENPRARSSRKLSAVARRGPLWEPGTPVDIVVRLRLDGAQYLMRAANQAITESM